MSSELSRIIRHATKQDATLIQCIGMICRRLGHRPGGGKRQRGENTWHVKIERKMDTDCRCLIAQRPQKSPNVTVGGLDEVTALQVTILTVEENLQEGNAELRKSV